MTPAMLQYLQDKIASWCTDLVNDERFQEVRPSRQSWVIGALMDVPNVFQQKEAAHGDGFDYGDGPVEEPLDPRWNGVARIDAPASTAPNVVKMKARAI